MRLALCLPLLLLLVGCTETDPLFFSEADALVVIRNRSGFTVDAIVADVVKATDIGDGRNRDLRTNSGQRRIIFEDTQTGLVVYDEVYALSSVETNYITLEDATSAVTFRNDSECCIEVVVDNLELFQIGTGQFRHLAIPVGVRVFELFRCDGTVLTTRAKLMERDQTFLYTLGAMECSP